MGSSVREHQDALRPTSVPKGAARGVCIGAGGWFSQASEGWRTGGEDNSLCGQAAAQTDPLWTAQTLVLLTLHCWRRSTAAASMQAGDLELE